jgi:hypothetical protein
MKLANKCKKIFQKDGQVAVINYCTKLNHVPWHFCRACDCLSPIEEGKCLICNNFAINNQIVDSNKVAIETKYVGPNNSRGSTIVAKANKQKIIVSYDHSLNPDENHAEAARALCRKNNWTGNLVKGGTKDGYVFVFAD